MNVSKEESPTDRSSYANLTPVMIVQLSAPHTWSAAIMPVLLSAAIAAPQVSQFPVALFACLLLICILMQSAVNTLNDYMDYVKGADTLDNQLDPTDAVLVYNNVNPKQVLALVFCQLGLGLLLGIYVIAQTGWTPLAIGAVGALVLVAYSVGKTPLSYLPVGEFASGFTMGGLEVLACSYVITGSFSFLPLLISVPLICTIGLINFTNNTCDIEKDVLANRKTLSVVLGREKARMCYHGLLYFAMACMAVLVAIFYTSGLVVVVCMLFASYPLVKALRANPLVLASRGPAMAQAVSINICLNTFYAMAVLMGSYVSLGF